VRPLAFLREVTVWRTSGAVHIFNVVPHGRRFLRSLVWASDASLCLDDGPATLGDASLAGDSILEIRRAAYAGRAAMEPSLVILRNIVQEMGVQVFVPRRFLRGLLPAALLCAYDFWQNGDDSLIGYPLNNNDGGPVSFLGDAESSLGDAESSLGAGKS
jgi:hypothetical protein